MKETTQLFKRLGLMACTVLAVLWVQFNAGNWANQSLNLAIQYAIEIGLVVGVCFPPIYALFLFKRVWPIHIQGLAQEHRAYLTGFVIFYLIIYAASLLIGHDIAAAEGLVTLLSAYMSSTALFWGIELRRTYFNPSYRTGQKYYLMGQIQLIKQDLHRAAQYFQLAAENGNALGQVHWAFILIEKNKTEPYLKMAIALFNHAVQTIMSGPHYAEGLYQLFRFHYLLDKPKKAIKYLKMAARNGHVQANLVMACASHRQTPGIKKNDLMALFYYCRSRWPHWGFLHILTAIGIWYSAVKVKIFSRLEECTEVYLAAVEPHLTPKAQLQLNAVQRDLLAKIQAKLKQYED